MNGNEHRCLSFSNEWTHRWFAQALTTTSVNATVWQLQRKDWFSHCDVTHNKVLFWTPDFSIFAIAMLNFWARSDYIWTKGWSNKSPACSSNRLYGLNTQTNTCFHPTTRSHVELQVVTATICGNEFPLKWCLGSALQELGHSRRAQYRDGDSPSDSDTFWVLSWGELFWAYLTLNVSVSCWKSWIRWPGRGRFGHWVMKKPVK